jgi:predicted transcriptional regulator
MTQKSWKDWTDAELTDEAQQGLRGQGAAVEMARRLKDSNNRLTWVNVALTAAARIVAIVQVWRH